MLDKALDVAPRVYTGLNEQHTIHWIEGQWKAQSASKEFPERLQSLHMDDTLIHLAQDVWKRGEREITFLDLCSGKDGVLIHSVKDKESFPQLHGFLSQHQGFAAHVVGITDAEKGVNQGTVLSHKIEEVGTGQLKSKIEVENYAYTITKAHTVAKLLDALDIKQLHLVLSTLGIGYFTPANFEQAIQDIASRLAPGGSFYANSWDMVPAGAERIPGGTNTMRENVSSEHPLNIAFGNLSDEESKQFQALPPKEQVDTYLRAFDFYVTRHLMTDQDAVHMLRDIPVLPIPAFVRKLYLYASEQDKQEVRDYLKRFGRKNEWVRTVDWDGSTNIIRVIKSAGAHQKHEEKHIKRISAREILQRMAGKKYVDSIVNTVWDFIERRFASAKLQDVDQAKLMFNNQVKSMDWNNAKGVMEQLNMSDVAHFWDWHTGRHNLQQFLVKRSQKRTTQAKLASLSRFQQNPGLEVYFNKHPDSTGLNFYIGRKTSGVAS